MAVTQATIPSAVDSGPLRACLLIIMGLGTELQQFVSFRSGPGAQLHVTHLEPTDEAWPPWLWIKFYWHGVTDTTKLSSQHGGGACCLSTCLYGILDPLRPDHRGWAALLWVAQWF